MLTTWSASSTTLSSFVSSSVMTFCHICQVWISAKVRLMPLCSCTRTNYQVLAITSPTAQVASIIQKLTFYLVRWLRLKRSFSSNIKEMPKGMNSEGSKTCSGNKKQRIQSKGINSKSWKLLRWRLLRMIKRILQAILLAVAPLRVIFHHIYHTKV